MADDEGKIEIGTSGVTILAPGYVPGEITAEDTDENQVGYYKSEASLVDFDLYQWAKADGETLEGTAASEAAEYESAAYEIDINGIPVWFYEATEEYDGSEYLTVTYLVENGDLFAELVFWMDGENAAKAVADIMNTLAIAENADITDGGNEIVLGTSTLKITTPVAYEKGELTAEDTDESQVGYYKSEASLVDFDVYQWTKAEGETAQSTAEAEAAEYGEGIEVTQTTINGNVVFGYYANEEFEGEAYPTYTAITECGNDFVEIVFWLDGDGAEQFANDILATLTAF